MEAGEVPCKSTPVMEPGGVCKNLHFHLCLSLRLRESIVKDLNRHSILRTHTHARMHTHLLNTNENERFFFWHIHVRKQLSDLYLITQQTEETKTVNGKEQKCNTS